MILIDTTIWIDFFLNNNNAKVSYLLNAINKRDDLCICGVILTEILQGIKNPKERHQVEDLLQMLIFLEMKKETFVLAADIFRDLRKKGITIRKSIDCMIAAVAIENNIPLLHNDRDFDPIQQYYHLQVINPSSSQYN